MEKEDEVSNVRATCFRDSCSERDLVVTREDRCDIYRILMKMRIISRHLDADYSLCKIILARIFSEILSEQHS